MTRIALTLGLLTMLASCGVEGDPERPDPQPVQPPPDVTATVTISDSGVYPGLGISQGWWNIYVGRGGGFGGLWW